MRNVSMVNGCYHYHYHFQCSMDSEIWVKTLNLVLELESITGNKCSKFQVFFINFIKNFNLKLDRRMDRQTDAHTEKHNVPSLDKKKKNTPGTDLRVLAVTDS